MRDSVQPVGLSAREMQEAYADFCAEGPFYDIVYPRAFEDFVRLCAYSEISEIGFRECGKVLVLKTTLVEVCGKEIGEFYIYLRRNPPDFTFENITRTEDGVSPGCHHPHVHPNGRMCMSSGEAEIKEKLRAGQVLTVVIVLLGVLWMRETHCQVGFPVCALELWPPSQRK